MVQGNLASGGIHLQGVKLVVAMEVSVFAYVSWAQDTSMWKYANSEIHAIFLNDIRLFFQSCYFRRDVICIAFGISKISREYLI